MMVDAQSSSWQILIALVLGRLTPQDGLNNPSKRFKLLVRTLFSLLPTLRWIDFLRQDDDLFELLKKRPRLVMKLYRPYLFHPISTQQCLQQLMAHYSLQKQLMHSHLYRRLFNSESIMLASFTGKNGEIFSFTLSLFQDFDREGELQLKFLDGGEQDLALATFSFGGTQSAPYVFIGGIQGGHREDSCGDDFIKRASKACHGMFPKKLALEMVMEIANLLGINELRGVSTQAHVYQNWRYYKFRKLFVNQYDQLWQEFGARRLNDSCFVLPTAMNHKPLELVESKKRSEYRKRYEMLDDIKQQLSQAMSR